MSRSVARLDVRRHDVAKLGGNHRLAPFMCQHDDVRDFFLSLNWTRPAVSTQARKVPLASRHNHGNRWGFGSTSSPTNAIISWVLPRMDTPQLQAAFDHGFDQAIVFHGFADCMRDYEIVMHTTADPG